MIPAYVLHHPSCKERTEIVKDIVDKTKATVFESYLLPNGKDGCRWSHMAVAKLARSLHPEKSYLVFEDDCVLEEGWQEALKGVEFADVVYLGYIDRSKNTVFGTHALYISPKARDIIIEHSEEYKNDVPDKGAFDFILSLLCRDYGLITCMPRFSNKDTYCYQKKGLRSQITGRIRN